MSGDEEKTAENSYLVRRQRRCVFNHALAFQYYALGLLYEGFTPEGVSVRLKYVGTREGSRYQSCSRAKCEFPLNFTLKIAPSAVALAP